MGITDVSRRSLLKGAALGAGIAALAAVPQTVHAAEVAAEAPAQGVVTVTAEAQGFGGPVSVTLTVDTATGGVADVQISGPEETPDRGGRAVASMQAAMVESGSIDDKQDIWNSCFSWQIK